MKNRYYEYSSRIAFLKTIVLKMVKAEDLTNIDLNPAEIYMLETKTFEEDIKAWVENITDKKIGVSLRSKQRMRKIMQKFLPGKKLPDPGPENLKSNLSIITSLLNLVSDKRIFYHFLEHEDKSGMGMPVPEGFTESPLNVVKRISTGNLSLIFLNQDYLAVKMEDIPQDLIEVRLYILNEIYRLVKSERFELFFFPIYHKGRAF